jgi:hypothetical protein
MADEEGVWNVKNSFFLGCYQQAISEAFGAHKVSAAGRSLCNFYMYRAYIEQGQHRMVLDEVRPDAPLAIQAVKLLATYASSGTTCAPSISTVINRAGWTFPGCQKTNFRYAFRPNFVIHC